MEKWEHLLNKNKAYDYLNSNLDIPTWRNTGGDKSARENSLDK